MMAGNIAAPDRCKPGFDTLGHFYGCFAHQQPGIAVQDRGRLNTVEVTNRPCSMQRHRDMGPSVVASGGNVMIQDPHRKYGKGRRDVELMEQRNCRPKGRSDRQPKARYLQWRATLNLSLSMVIGSIARLIRGQCLVRSPQYCTGGFGDPGYADNVGLAANRRSRLTQILS